MAIENRTLEVGTRLVARYKGQTHVVAVIDSPEGTRFRNVASNVHFKSPSAAGSAIMGGIACNGWRFFTIEGQEQPASTPHAEKKPRAPKGGNGASEPKAKAPAAPRVYKLIRRTPNQKGVEEGSTRVFCDACMRSFIHEGADIPTECPEDHRSEDPALTTAAS